MGSVLPLATYWEELAKESRNLSGPISKRLLFTSRRLNSGFTIECPNLNAAVTNELSILALTRLLYSL